MKGQGMQDARQKILFWFALVFAVFQLIVPVFLYIIDLQLRAIHVFFGISTALLTFPFAQKVRNGNRILFWDVFLIVLVIIANINIYFKALQIYAVPGESTTADIVLGCILALIILDAARRAVGWPIPILVILMFGYVFLSPWMPGMWKFSALPFEYVITSVYYSPLGIYGSVTGMSATFISMFIIFGAILSTTGGGKTFVDLALFITGRFRGGPAKAAVVASAMFGSISGSTVANVSVTGNYTIPLMKKLGYEPNFAGAVEAIASTGGGFTPPIMSITAFMMAEFLDIPYIRIIGYALIPCLLFYTCVFVSVHLETVRRGLVRLPEEEIPERRSIINFWRLGNLFTPMAVLLLLLMKGYPLVTAGFYTCATAIVISLVSGFSFSRIKERTIQIVEGLSQGGQDLARIVPILVAVNMLVNLIGITGLAPKISGLIVDFGGKNLYFALIIATVVPLLLGTALTVVPIYVLSVALLVPAFLQLEVDIVAAHLFFIYWAVLGGVTPPVGITAMVAAGIAGGNWVKTCFVAIRLGIVAFLLPFFFVVNPALVARKAPMEVFLFGISGVGGAVLLAYGFFGPYRGWVNILLRLVYIACGFLLLAPNHTLTMIGILMVAVAVIIDFLGHRRRRLLLATKRGKDYVSPSVKLK
jgi:TRAP transporter 4TM/12TM fusion protein